MALGSMFHVLYDLETSNVWPFTHHVRIPGGPLFPAWEETTLCPWSWLQRLEGFIQQPAFVQRREQRTTLSRSWPLLLDLRWSPWTGFLGLSNPPGSCGQGEALACPPELRTCPQRPPAP